MLKMEVDAALCTIIDILDEDIDGEYALAGADRGEARPFPLSPRRPSMQTSLATSSV